MFLLIYYSGKDILLNFGIETEVNVISCPIDLNILKEAEGCVIFNYAEEM